MEEHERLADGLEREVDDMKRKADKLEQQIDDVRTDWRRKQQDPGVPGADTADDDQLDRRPPPGGMERE